MASSQSPDTANHNGQILCASVILLILPTVFVSLRLASRYISKAGLWWDDVTVIVCMILSWGLNITNILNSRHYLGHHLKEFHTPVILFWQYLYSFEVLYSLAMTFMKISVLLFLYRIFAVTSFRRIVCACGAFVVAFGAASTLCFLLECLPIRDFWMSAAGQKGGQCIKLIRFMLVNGCINTVTDFALLILPLPMLWHLRADTLQKCVLTVLFISGLTVTAVSMVRLVVITRYHGEDYTDDFFQTCIWTAAEPAIAVACASLPSLRPLFVRAIRGDAWKSDVGKDHCFWSSDHVTTIWRSGSKVHDRNFNRLPESRNGIPGIWMHTNNVAVYGGRTSPEIEESVSELTAPQEDIETPRNRIRAKTTVVLTISQRLDWRDDLF